ncbi:MAG: serine protease [Bacteriovoracaceae bacterium]
MISLKFIISAALYLAFGISMALAEANFHKSSEILQEDGFKIYDSASKATRVMLQKIEGKLHPFCSGAFISNTGYFLTALHCVDDFIDTSNITNLSIKTGKDIRTRRYARIIKIKNQVPDQSLLDTVEISRVASDKKIQIVFLGKGRKDYQTLIPDSDFGIDTILTKEQLDEIQDYNEDFAILKIQTEDQSVDCILAAENDAQVEDAVLMIGYPNKAIRGKPEFEGNSDGVSQYFTFGKIRKTWLEAPIVDKLSLTENNFHLIDSILMPPKLILTDLDDNGKASGAPILNQNGLLVGIGISSFSDDNSYQEATHTGVRITTAYNSIKEKLGFESIRKFFSCKNK